MKGTEQMERLVGEQKDLLAELHSHYNAAETLVLCSN